MVILKNIIIFELKFLRIVNVKYLKTQMVSVAGRA